MKIKESFPVLICAGILLSFGCAVTAGKPDAESDGYENKKTVQKHSEDKEMSKPNIIFDTDMGNDGRWCFCTRLFRMGMPISASCW